MPSTHANANIVVVVFVDCSAPVEHALRSTRLSHNSAAWASTCSTSLYFTVDSLGSCFPLIIETCVLDRDNL